MPGPLITQLLLALPCPEERNVHREDEFDHHRSAPEYSYICRCHCDAGWQVTISVVYKLILRPESHPPASHDKPI